MTATTQQLASGVPPLLRQADAEDQRITSRQPVRPTIQPQVE